MPLERAPSEAFCRRLRSCQAQRDPVPEGRVEGVADVVLLIFVTSSSPATIRAAMEIGPVTVIK